MDGFTGLGLSDEVRAALEKMGYEAPSPVQAEAIPLLMDQRDVIAQALTGTGKTAAFGIPIVERADPSQRTPGALVLCPTRELAMQVAGEISRIGQSKGVCVLPVYGGQSYDRQTRMLRQGVQVVVATPGRLIDLIERRALTLADAGILVLDEADEMLKMGFLEDVERIIAEIPEDRQTALFSATMPDEIVELSRRHMREPVRVTLSEPRALTAPAVDQFYYQVPRPYKIEALTRLLDYKNPDLALVFCATKRMVDDLTAELMGRGYRVEAIHGDLSQTQRERVLGMARAGRLDVLVATDVAARGIDIPEITHVFNFDLPQDPEYYVHRIGRTGRAGRAGEALTIVAPWEARELRVIERATGARIERAEVPTIVELERRDLEDLGRRIERVLAGENGDWNRHRSTVDALVDRYDPADIAAAALAVIAGPEKKRTDIPAAQQAPAGGRGGPFRPRDGRPPRRAHAVGRPPRPWERDRGQRNDRGPFGPRDGRSDGPFNRDRPAGPDARVSDRDRGPREWDENPDRGRGGDRGGRPDPRDRDRRPPRRY